jgi:hypothetical protein
MFSIFFRTAFLSFETVPRQQKTLLWNSLRLNSFSKILFLLLESTHFKASYRWQRKWKTDKNRLNTFFPWILRVYLFLQQTTTWPREFSLKTWRNHKQDRWHDYGTNQGRGSSPEAPMYFMQFAYLCWKTIIIWHHEKHVASYQKTSSSFFPFPFVPWDGREKGNEKFCLFISVGLQEFFYMP